MRLSHFSNAAVIEPRSVEQDSRFKPRGLWVSVDGEDDWPWWCAAEEYSIGPNRFRVEVADDRLLVLATVDQIREFDREFCLGRRDVDWAAVAERWPGIIIAPYQWSLRLSEVRWYYSWDCASGCIWDATVITSVSRLLAPAEMEPSP